MKPVGWVVASMWAAAVAAQQPRYHFYAGSTHAHTSFTWSHGEMLQKSDCKGVRIYGLKPGSEDEFEWKDVAKPNAPCFAMYIINGWQYHGPDMKLKPDWRKFQGVPAAHFAAARAAGFDFYVTTDHSQEAPFFPETTDNPQWLASKKEAVAATENGKFVALAGFEFSENDGPGGTGHINVINSDRTLNAIQPGVDLTYFYKWLATVKPNGEGPVVASFNHPDVHSYADYTGRTAAATDIITMYEVLNSNWHVHYKGWIAALDAGWKVSPTSGLDNHGLTGIPTMKSRVFVLATAKTKLGILDAMKHRRTYATLDGDLQCSYTVNGEIMGSTLKKPATFAFAIHCVDPDTDDPKAKITKMDIVTDGGTIVETWKPDAPSTTADWKVSLQDAKVHYFFVRVWDAGGGDAPKPNPAEPVAWLAPVWTGVPSPMQPMLSVDEVKRRGGAGDEQP